MHDHGQPPRDRNLGPHFAPTLEHLEAQRFSQLQRLTRVSRTFAASQRRARTALSPHLVM